MNTVTLRPSLMHKPQRLFCLQRQVSVRVLQRNGLIGYMCMCVCMRVYKEIYYKELAHVIIKAEKSPKSKVSRLKTHEIQWYSSNLSPMV